MVFHEANNKKRNGNLVFKTANTMTALSNDFFNVTENASNLICRNLYKMSCYTVLVQYV